MIKNSNHNNYYYIYIYSKKQEIIYMLEYMIYVG